MHTHTDTHTHTAKISPNGVSTDVFKEVVTLCIIVEVDGSVGIGVMSGDKVGDGTSWDSQGPQNCVCVCVCVVCWEWGKPQITV